MAFLKTDEQEPEPDSFMLSNDNGTQYKFRAGTNAKALEWCHFITKAANGNKRPIPENLISLDWRLETVFFLLGRSKLYNKKDILILWS